jgi:hypothetical protein
MLLNDRLKRYRFLTGVEKGIFERYEFVRPRSLA